MAGGTRDPGFPLDQPGNPLLRVKGLVPSHT